MLHMALNPGLVGQGQHSELGMDLEYLRFIIIRGKGTVRLKVIICMITSQGHSKESGQGVGVGVAG